MMNLLLKFEGYPPAVLIALLLHASLLWFFLDRELSPDTMVKIEPNYVSVTTARQNPQRLRRIEQLELLRAEDQRKAREKETREQAARQRAAREKDAADKAAADRKRKAEADRQAQVQRQAETRQAEERRLAEARRQAEAERLRQAEAQRQRDAAQAEAARQARASSQAQQAENDLVGQYTAIIHDLISQNWVIPPSARNGMTAIVELRTTPVGDIVNYRVIQGSGNSAFDQSVLQAVARVGNLQELRDLPNDIYEPNFRIFHLQFQPEDLLR